MRNFIYLRFQAQTEEDIPLESRTPSSLDAVLSSRTGGFSIENINNKVGK